MTDGARPAVLDTDIGSDVDDLLALVLLAAAPEVDLVGVTTVYGDTALRARMARWVCDRMGRPEVTVAAGARDTLANRPVWWAGHEGDGIPGLDRVAIDAAEPAAAYLPRVAREHAGRLDLFAIGPLTNVAAAIRADARFAGSIRHLHVMGGAFWLDRDRPEHNIACDPEAADVVFRAGIPISIAGLDVTTKVWLRDEAVRAIGRARGELGAMLEEQVRRWWSFRGTTQDNPHDPLAVLMALRPGLFRFEACDVRIGLGEADLARTWADNCGRGAVRVAADIDAAGASRELVRRLMGSAVTSARSNAGRVGDWGSAKGIRT